MKLSELKTLNIAYKIAQKYDFVPDPRDLSDSEFIDLSDETKVDKELLFRIMDNYQDCNTPELSERVFRIIDNL